MAKRSTPESNVHLHDLVECGYQRLRKPERKRQLRPRHQQLRHQALEEGGRTFMSRHHSNNLDTRLLNFEVLVLYPGLDDIQRRRHNKRRRRSRRRGHKILAPGCLVVVFQLEEILLRGGRATKQREGARRIACCCPPPAAIQSKTLIGDDAEHASSAESFRVGLAFDLEDIKR